jgi:hypothetical protein
MGMVKRGPKSNPEAKYVIRGDCWLWIGARINGNPMMKVDGRPQMVRRVFWQQINGETRHRLKVTCENPDDCVNPYHCVPRLVAKPPPKLTREQRHEVWWEIWRLRGCEKVETIARMYNMAPTYISKIHTRGRIGELPRVRMTP